MLTRTSILLPVLVLSIPVDRALAKDGYENFSMPKTSSRAEVPDTSLSFNSSKVQFRGIKVKIKEPNVTQEDYLFARETFLAEKRDESIRLLRQQIDSGLRANLDNMLLRLGQLYAEKYMELSYFENEMYSRTLEIYEKEKEKNPSAKRPPLDNSRSQRYLSDATAIFYDLEKKFPKHPKLDEILFFIGFVELEAGNTDKGVRYLERVVKQYPNSRKHDDALVYLGDYYFEKSNFREASARYRILVAKEDAPLYYYAFYKLAWCTLNLGDAQKALRDIKTLISSLKGASDRAKFNLREQALKDLVVFYGEAETIDDAMEYFTEVQGKEKAVENLKLIADIMRSKARDVGAIKAYEKLIEEYGDALDAPRLYVGLYEALSRSGRSEKALETLLTGLERYGEKSSWADDFPSGKIEEVRENRNYLREEAEKAAFFYHHSAQKSSNWQSYDSALKLYDAITTHFPSAPSRKKIAFFRAEILFSQGKWLLAAEAYMTAAKASPKDKMNDEAVYNALLSLDRLTAKENTLERYSKEEQKTVSTEEKKIPSNELKFIEVGEYYLQEYPKGEKAADVKFRIGAIYYQYHHFDKALMVFKELSTQHPSHRSAATAAHIVLDIHNIKKDFVSLLKTAKEFSQIKELGDARFKAEVASITNEINFKKIESYETKGEWREAGNNYISFYEADPKGALAEQSLYNAYVCYGKANAADLAEKTARLFTSSFPASKYSSGLVLFLAKNAEQCFEFEEAKKQYHDFYKRYPREKEAPKALYNAAVFAELTDDAKTALGLYGEYVAKGYATNPQEKRAILISQAKQYRKLGDWARFTAMYRQLAKESKTLQDKLEFLGELARQFDKAGRTKEKQGVLAEVRGMRVTAEQGKELKGAAALIYAETVFREVAAVREKYDKITLRFPPEALLVSIKKREQLLTQLLAAYDRVIEIGVPEWGVAALYEKSEAYASFVKAFRAVKIPASYNGETRTEAEKALQGIDEKLVKPLEAKAQELTKLCVTRSTEFFVANEYANKCREGVATNSKEAGPVGIMPQPAYWSTRWLGDG